MKSPLCPPGSFRLLNTNKRWLCRSKPSALAFSKNLIRPYSAFAEVRPLEAQSGIIEKLGFATWQGGRPWDVLVPLDASPAPQPRRPQLGTVVVHVEVSGSSRLHNPLSLNLER